jgi:YihY family inner membrane protein
MFRKLRQMVEDVRWEDAADPSFWVGFVRRQARLCFYILRELVRNRCPQQAAALTFTTLLALVPLFAVAFSFFRGFAALEGVESRAQNAIFRSILAGPLLEGGGPGEPRSEEPTPAVPAPENDLPAEELLAAAEARPRGRAAGTTLRLYLEAMGEGASAAAVRSGVSTLRLGGAGSLRRAFGALSMDSYRRYLEAAGLEGEATARRGPPGQEAAGLYEKGRKLAQSGEYAEAVTALESAEAAGHPAEQTRLALGAAHEGLADELAAQGRPAEAVEAYRSALLRRFDALLLASRSRTEERLADIIRRHDATLSKLGEALLTLGREGADLYRRLADEGDPRAEAVLGQALADLQEAASLLEHSSEAHYALGRLHDSAGRSGKAAEAYRTAFERSREVAARGISLAVVDYIRMFIQKVGRAEIGILGILFLLVAATMLLNTIERTLNHIWKVTERRPFWIKFTSFCTLIWLGPALIGASLWAQERLGGYIETYLGEMPVFGDLVQLLIGLGEHVLPLVTTWLVLVALYKFLPHTHVKFKSVAWGALLGAVLLHGARPLFSLYVLKAVRYETIYGSLGAIPVFLLWIWLLWLTVLFGAEVSFTIQNVSLLRFRDKLHELSSIFIDRYLAARIMMYVAREFWETGNPVTAQRLAEILQITPEEAADAAGRLVRLGLLTPVGAERDEFHPARDLSKLKLSEVLSITDRFRAESRSARAADRPYEDKLEAAFRASIQAQEEALEGMTFRELLQKCEQDRSKWPNAGRAR